MAVRIVNPSISGAGIVSDPSALKKAANLSDLSNVATALTNLGIGTLPTRVSSLETKYVRSTRFEIISSGTSGAVTLPTGSTVVLDDFGGTVDAIAAQVTSGRPIFENVRDAGSVIITTTFDASGNYVLSGTPSSYPVAIVYRVRQTLLNFNGTDSNIIGEYNIENGVDLHASTHLPSGIDPLTTAAPTTNLNGSTTNATGSANSLARSDHTHAIDSATTLVAGLMSASDKTKLNAITGTNTGDQTISLTGDIVGSGTGSFATTIAANVVSNSKLAQVATATFKGRTTAGTGDPEDLTVAQAKTLLNLSGTNTGDQTTITGNAGTATALQTARTINGVSFDGTANITVTAAAGTLTGTTLNSTVVNSSLTSVGTLASLTVTATITGSITGNAGTATILQTARTINGVSFDGSTNITVTAAAGTLTGTTLNATVVSSSLTSVGTITTGVWTGTAIAAINGGTGQTSYAVGDLLYASTTTALSRLADVATGNVLLSGGVSTAPAWGQVADAHIVAHTSSKITITTKGQLNTAIVYTDQANTFGAFNQIFPSSRLLVQNPGATFNYTVAGSAITAGRTLTLPLTTQTETLAVQPVVLQSSPTNPTGTTSTTGVMMGIAGAITPVVTGRVFIMISGTLNNTTGDAGAQVQLRTGTGAAPANGAALTGTTRGGPVKGQATSSGATTTPLITPFSCNAIVTGLTVGTAIWIDVELAAITAGTATVTGLSLSAYEL